MEDEILESTKSKARDRLKCELCSQTFKDPRRLPCTHSFCCQCLQRHWESIPSQEGKRPGAFCCPTCNALIGLPHGGVSEFPLDTRVTDIMDSAVNELRDILRKKYLAKNGATDLGSLDSIDVESQGSEFSRWGSSTDTDTQVHQNGSKYFNKYHQSATSFEPLHKNVSLPTDRTKFCRQRPEYSSLREINRRKANSLRAAFDIQPDSSSLEGLSYHKEFSTSSSISSSKHFSSSNLFSTHDENLAKDFKANNIRNSFISDTTSSYHSSENISLEGFSTSQNEGTHHRSSFQRGCRRHQSLREKSSHRTFLPAETVFEEALKMPSYKNDTERKWKFQEKSHILEESFASSLSKNDDDSNMFAENSTWNNDINPNTQNHLLKLDDIGEGSFSNSELSDTGTGYFPTHCMENAMKKDQVHSTSEPLLAEMPPFQSCSSSVNLEGLRTCTTVEKPIIGLRIHVPKNAFEFQERDALREFDFLTEQDEGIGLDSEASDSMASVGLSYLSTETNLPELHHDKEQNYLSMSSSDADSAEQCTNNTEAAEVIDNHFLDENQLIVNQLYNSNPSEMGMNGGMEGEHSSNFDEPDLSESANNSTYYKPNRKNLSDPLEKCTSRSCSQSDCEDTKPSNRKLVEEMNGDCVVRSAQDTFNERKELRPTGQGSADPDSEQNCHKEAIREGSATLHHVSQQEYLMPTGVAILAQGTMVVADYGIGCLQYYNSGDNSLSYKIDGMKPFSIAINPVNNQVIVGDRKRKTVCIFDDCGSDIAQWDSNMFNWICGIGVLKNGDLVILDRSKSEIGIYKPDGTLVQSFGSYGCGDNQLCMGEFLVVDELDRIIACDSGNHSIKIFNHTGSLLQKFGSRGIGDGEMQWPKGICIDKSNNIIIADTCNNRLSMFSSSGVFVQQLVSNISMPYAVSYNNNSVAVTRYSVMGQSQFLLYNLQS